MLHEKEDTDGQQVGRNRDEGLDGMNENETRSLGCCRLRMTFRHARTHPPSPRRGEGRGYGKNVCIQDDRTFANLACHPSLLPTRCAGVVTPYSASTNTSPSDVSTSFAVYP